MRKGIGLIFVLGLFPTTAAYAQGVVPAPAWTAVASTGAIDEAPASVTPPIYQFTGSALEYRTAGFAATAPIVARYNVTDIGGTGFPGWTTLELGAFDGGAASNVRATLFQVDPCTGQLTALCTANSDQTTSDCDRCNFTQLIDFTNFLYMVEVTITRTSGNASPRAHTLRIF